MDQKAMLDVASQHDAAISAQMARFGKAILSVPPQSLAKVPPVHELDLTASEDVDPFGGNVNNRKVCERIASQNRTIYTNAHRIIHTGDPNKAARDVAKSKELNPEAMSDQELEQEENKRLAKALASKGTPTPGSPAADRAKAAENATEVEAGRQTPTPQEAREGEQGISVVDRGVHAPAVNAPPAWTPNAGAARK